MRGQTWGPPKSTGEGAAGVGEANVESPGDEAVVDAHVRAKAAVEQERRERAAQALT